MENEDIRSEYKTARLYVSEICEKLGINESKFFRIMRRQLTFQQREKILNAINDVKMEKFQELSSTYEP